MKRQRETLTGKECYFWKERTFSTASPMTTLCKPSLLQGRRTSFLPPVLQYCSLCGRFLSVASLHELIHEGTMTSLGLAVSEGQRKAVVIDCSSSPPQVYHAGEPVPPLGLSEVAFFALRTNDLNVACSFSRLS